jgi:hypothetical protein
MVKEMARHKSPPRRVRGGAKSIRSQESNIVAVQREGLRNLEKGRRLQRLQVERDRQARVREFKARQRLGITALPFFGPQGLGHAAPVRARYLDMFAVTGATPLPVLAEGDSWFCYPVPLAGGGIIDHLQLMAPIRPLNLAHYGDPVQTIMGVHQRERLEQYLGDASWGFRALLFSGGGDDLVGDQFCFWLRDHRPGLPPNQALDSDRLGDIIDVVEAGYRDLIAIRDRIAPDCVIFAHAYDFPQPSDVGVCGFGPWMKPSLDYRGWTNPGDQFIVAKQLLLRFHEILAGLVGPKFVLVPTQGLLDPANDWANEIHPNRAGFRKLAAAFRDALAAQFPDVVPPRALARDGG